MTRRNIAYAASSSLPSGNSEGFAMRIACVRPNTISAFSMFTSLLRGELVGDTPILASGEGFVNKAEKIFEGGAA